MSRNLTFSRAALSVNRELIALYWQIGKSIVEKQRTEGWGKSVVERLAADLHREFSSLKGFSPRNIWRMRSFYLAWTEEAIKLPENAKFFDGANLPQPVAEIPWFQNLLLLEKLKNPLDRLWYAQKTLENGWSRNILSLQIESKLHRRHGKAINNFKATLPPPQSDLAQQALKDPYVFDFLSLREKLNERSTENELLSHITRFLLEMGSGFAFVGQQHHLNVNGEDYYLDLLFYHVRLHCFVVLELKAGPFKPEYVGKMNFYLSAVDDSLRTPADNPSIGLILCRDKNRIVAEYALRDVSKPIGVAGWKTKLTASLPRHLKNKLPTIEQLENELKKENFPPRSHR